MLFDYQNITSRAANAENIGGGISAACFAGNGRKGSPCKEGLAPGETYDLLDVDGPGIVRHIWMTVPTQIPAFLRGLIIRIYWENNAIPSVQAPVGDFFGIAHARLKAMTNRYTSFLNARGLNAWFPMPFRKHARISIENVSDMILPMLFYQVDFTTGDTIGEDALLFHAQFNRYKPDFGEDFVILDGAKGPGRFLGCTLGVLPDQSVQGWWGEGEIKMYFDGEEHPTVCTTGFEDYIGMAWGLQEAVSPEQGCALCDKEAGAYSVYRWHDNSPIFFRNSLRVTVQQMGYGDSVNVKPVLKEHFKCYPAAGEHNNTMCYYDRSDDYCCVAYWYQKEVNKEIQPMLSYEELIRDVVDYKAEGIKRLDL